MAATNGLVAGMYYVAIARRDSNGYPMGSLVTPDSPSNGTVYASYLVNHPVGYTPASPTRDVAGSHGGQKQGPQRDLGVSAYGTGTITLAHFDEGFHALVSGSLVDTTIMTAWNTTTQNVRNAALPQFILYVYLGFTTAAGAIEFLTTVYHNVQIQPVMPSGSQAGGSNPNPLAYTFVPNVSPRTGMGRLLSASSLSVTDNTDMMTQYRYSAPIYVVTYVDDNSTGSYIFPYRPVSSDATGAASNSISKDGVTQAVTSVSTTTGVVTQIAAGAAATKWVTALPTNFVAL